MSDPLKILIIEDDTNFRTLAMQVFDGNEKFYAVTGKAGINKYKEIAPDITLLDIGLPDITGIEVLDKIIGYDPEAFVVMLTASRIRQDVFKSEELGAAGYILKPCSPAKLLECIGRYHAFKRELEELSSEERASKLLSKLKVDALQSDQDEIEEAPKKKAKKPTTKTTTDSGFTPEVQDVLNQWRVLFVDDYDVNRERAQVQLSKLGCTVDIAKDGDEVLSKMNEQFYNLVFLDANIKKPDGYEVSKSIRRMQSDSVKKTAIIGMIQENYEIDTHKWHYAGMDNYIRKPAQFLKLRQALKKFAELDLDEMIE